MAQKDKKELKNNKDKTSFFKSFKAELKKVVWPTPKQLFNNTIAVLAIVLITTIIVFVLDLTFDLANKYGIDRVKQVVSNSSVNETTDNEEETDTNNNEVVDNNETSENTTQNNESTAENVLEDNNQITNTSNE